MKPKVRYGLVVGSIGAVVNIGISALFGFCGPIATLVAGGLAGWLTARALIGVQRSESVAQGAMSGAIAGSLMLVGQVIGGIGALLLIQASGTQPIFGKLPTNGVENAAYWAAGIGVGLCFGVIGLLLGAGTGAGAAYLGWRAPDLQGATAVATETQVG